jgi:hypothetical protein
MAAGITFLTALMLLATQLMLLGSTGKWPSITLASELDISADRVFFDWTILNRPIQFIVFDVQLWIILVFAAGLIYWVMDWTSERLGLPRASPPPVPVLREETPEPQAAASPADSPNT